MTDHALIDRFRQARRDQALAVLDGLHAVKHALRFGAALEEIVSPDVDATLGLAAEVAPDICAQLTGGLAPVSPEDYRLLSPVPPDTGVIAIARRPPVEPYDVLAGQSASPVVLLENPRNPFNIGAAVRVAAAAGAAGVLVTGQQDPWHPAAIVSAAGLQFALPVARINSLPPSDREVVAIDPARGRDAVGRCSPRPGPGIRHGKARYQHRAAVVVHEASGDSHGSRGLQPEPGDIGRRRPLCPEVSLT